MAILEFLTGPSAGHCYELLHDQTVVGRYPFCDLVVPAKTVSRQHARITRTAEGYMVEDLGSVNGTFVNGQRIHGRIRLANQDRIQLYDVAMRFHEGPLDIETVARRAALETEIGVPTPVAAEDAPEEIVHSLDAAAPGAGIASADTKLQAVLEIVRNLGGSLAVEEMLERVLESLFALFTQAERGHVLLATGPTGELVPWGIKESRKTGAGSSITLRPINRKLADRVMADRRAVLISQTLTVPPLAPDDSVLDDDRQRSVICAPMMGPSADPLGVIHLETDDPRRPFGRDDLEILVSVATVAGRAVEFAREHESRLLLQRRDRELAGAREVQMHMLPRSRPQVRGYQFYDHYSPAEEVGGDFLAYVPLAEGRLAVAVGDVAGKGFPAALMMAQLSAEVRYRLASSDPVEAVRGLNQFLADMNDRFVTFVAAVLDPEDHTLTVVNAGHMPPLLRRAAAGPVEELGARQGSPPLGVEPASTFRHVVFQLAPGDLVLIYTDGISEARNPAGEPYGVARVIERVGEGPAHVERLAVDLLADVERFRAGRAPADDVCLVTFARARS